MASDLPCIPDFGDYVPDQFKTFVRSLKCCRPTGDQLYSLLYAIGQSIGLVTTDVLQPAQDELVSAFINFAVVMTAPWVLMFIALIVLLISARVIGPLAGIFFLLITLLIAGLAVFWVLYSVGNSSGIIFNDVVDGIKNNYQNNQTAILTYLFRAYTLGVPCNPNEPNACCGFIDRTCVSGCTDIYLVDPDSILVNSSGSLTIGLLSDSSDVNGTITVPGSLLGTTGDMAVPFTSSPFFQIIPYQTGSTAGIENVEFVIRHGTGPFYNYTYPVSVHEAVATIMSDQPSSAQDSGETGAPISLSQNSSVSDELFTEELPGITNGALPQEMASDPLTITAWDRLQAKWAERNCRSCYRDKK